MKQTLISFCCILMAALSGNAAGRSVVIDTRAAGELEALLGDELLTVEELTVSGPVNEADIKAMWKASYHGRLRELNLAAADIEGKKIPDYAFRYGADTVMVCSTLLEKVILPDDVEEIGEAAFSGSVFLKSVSMPNSLRRIGRGAFSSCVSLESVGVFPDALEEICDYAFTGCGHLSKLTFPKGLKNIGVSAFESTALTEVVLPASVEMVGRQAFRKCQSLRKFSLPENTSPTLKMLSSALANNTVLESVDFANGKVPESFAFSDFSLHKVKLSGEDGYVGLDAFALCRGLESVELGEGITSLQTSAFYGCSRVRSMILPSTLAKIEYNSLCLPGLESLYCKAAVPPAFEDYMPDWGGPFSDVKVVSNRIDTPKDIPVYVPVGAAELYRFASGWSYFTNYIEIAEFPTNSQWESENAEPEMDNAEVIMANAGELASRLGNGLRKIKSLIVKGPINDSDFATMRDAAFNGRLEVLDLSGAIVEGRKIPAGAFWNNKEMGLRGVSCPTWLRSVVLPDDIEEIGDDAFCCSFFLKEINIPQSVKRIGSNAFLRCENLEINEMWFYAGIVEIADNAFCGCSKLKNVSLPVSLQRIGSGAFASTGVETLVVPEGIMAIGEGAFSGCTHLTEATLPNSLTDLSESKELFSNDINLVSIHLPNGVTTIPERMAYGCQSLMNINLPQSIVDINPSAFYQCRSLKSLLIGDNINTLSRTAFKACIDVSELVLPNGRYTIYDRAFSQISGLKRIYSKAATPPYCEIYYLNGENIGPFDTVSNPPYAQIVTTPDDTPRDIPVYVPRGSAEAYRSAPGWDYFTNFIETDEFPDASVGEVAVPGSDVEVRVEAGRVILAGSGGAFHDYAVYTVDGRVVASGRISGEAAVSVAPGLYIVRCGSRTAKVAVP